MKHLRARIILLASWLILFSTIERFSGSVVISREAYGLVLAIVLIILIRPTWLKIPIWTLMAAPIVLLLILKFMIGGFSSEKAFAFTILEVFALILTVLLTYWMSMSISGLEDDAEKTTDNHHDQTLESTASGERYIYREVRRARNHQRPLSLLAISVDDNSIVHSTDIVMHDAQLALLKKHKESFLAKLLCIELEDCSIIVQSNGYFLVALPETKPEEVPIIIERLRKKAADQVGVCLQIGSSSLPMDSYTFEGLVDKATNQMRTSQNEQLVNSFERLPVETR